MIDLGAIFPTFAILLGVLVARYAAVSGLGWRWSCRLARAGVPRLGRAEPRRSEILRDIFSSLQSTVVFAGVGTALWLGSDAGWTRIYRDPGARGWAWLPISLLILIALQDAWFYASHRWLHRPGLYRRLPGVRHWITATHHQRHHDRPTANFGLFFSIWDRLFGTEQVDPAPFEAEHDWVIVGGGLAGSLLASRLLRARPDSRIVLLERGERLGGNHTWCFHDSDLAPVERAELAPLVHARWDEHEVSFPKFRRVVRAPYSCITSDSLHRGLAGKLGARLRLGVTAQILDDHRVRLGDGTELTAHCVVDARGFPSEVAPPSHCGWQKFLGLELELESAHGLVRPMLMDAVCEQREGFRFFYVLPLGRTCLLVEDTRYSVDPSLDEADLESEIRRYAEARGWRIQAVRRRERGALPIPFAAPSAPMPGPGSAGIIVGMKGGFFHPTTGYSLPDAVRLAGRLAALPTEGPIDAGRVRAQLVAYRSETYPARRFYALLNRMLFCSAAGQRYRVLERFYGLPEGLVARFYRGQSTWGDRVRILWGRPPVPIYPAICAAVGGRVSR